jgi:hypothetical protein
VKTRLQIEGCGLQLDSPGACGRASSRHLVQHPLCCLAPFASTFSVHSPTPAKSIHPALLPHGSGVLPVVPTC